MSAAAATNRPTKGLTPGMMALRFPCYAGVRYGEVPAPRKGAPQQC